MGSLIAWVRARPTVLDACFAITIGVLVAVTSVPAGDDQPGIREMDPAAVGIIACATLGLALRRVTPAACLVIVLASTLAFLNQQYPYGPIFAFSSIAMYSVAAWRSTRYTVVAAVFMVLGHTPWAIWYDRDPEGPIMNLLGSIGWIAGSAAIGVAVRTARASRARTLAEDRLRHGYAERLRIAQEVHDVVGHGLAVISVHAGAALHVLSKGDAPPEVVRSLSAIRRASGGALDELRLTLATFTGALNGRTPTPGLERVPELVAATNVDGLRVEYTVSGERGEVPAAVDLAGYRIVQEALTNVVRHAAAEHADVVVAYEPDLVRVTITDDGHGSNGTANVGSGLDSMRERASSVRGTVSAGPRPAGGFEVSAVLPYSGRAA
jgi:signal transduction histidine kinase